MRKLYDDLALFCMVVNAGSLKRASEEMGIPHSTVSRRIEALEASLGRPLLSRGARQIQPTDLGRRLYQQCAPLFVRLRHSLAETLDEPPTLAGPLRVAMPVWAGQRFLGRWLIEFAERFPELDLDLHLCNASGEPQGREVDLVFRVGPLPDATAVARRLWSIPYALLAHPDYAANYRLDERPLTPGALSELPCVVVLPMRRWTLSHRDHGQRQVLPNARVTVNELGLAHYAVSRGQVLGCLPRALNRPGTLLEPACDGWSPLERSMYALYGGERHSHGRIDLVIDHVLACYRLAGGQPD